MARAALLIFKSVLGLFAGLALAFAGYRLAKSMAGLAGFLAGFALGLAVGFAAGPVAGIFAAIVVGLIFALLFALAFRIVGGALGGAVAYALAAIFGAPMWLLVILVLAGALAGLIMNKLMIVLATAVLGGWIGMRSALELLADMGVLRAAGSDVPLLVGALLLTALGAAAQWRDVRHL